MEEKRKVYLSTLQSKLNLNEELQNQKSVVF